MGAVGAASVDDLPVVIRFLLQHMTPSNAKPTLRALRTGMPLDLLGSTAPAAGPASTRQASGEALVLDALQTAMRLRKEVTTLVVRHLEAVSTANDHSPLDWWLLCAAYTTSAPAERKKVLRLAVDKAASRRLTPSLLRAAIRGHGVALSPHFGSLMEIASGLLQKPSPPARESGELLYLLSFDEFAEVFRRQELLGHLMAHVGSGAPSEVEAALGVLVSLATNDAAAVHQFAPFLTYILDYLATLTVPQARLAFELFARLAYDGATAGGSRLTDELLITIRKQLSSSNPHFKCLGLLGGSCMLQRLGVRRDGADEDEPMPVAASQAAASQPAPPMSCRMADANSLFSMMCKHSANADGTYSFLLHELSHLVAVREPANALGRPLLGLISDRISSKFESVYLIDTTEAGAATAAVRGLWPKLCLDIDRTSDDAIALNIVPMLARLDGKAALQRHAVSTLSANFQLLRLCEAASADDGESLEGVDAVLGAPLVLFEPRLLGPKLEALAAATDDTREAVCLALFYAVDWLRELLNGFCNQREPEMRAKVVLRATQLVVLEGVLDACLAVTPHFRLPGIIGDQRAPAKQKKPAEKTEKAKKAAAKPKPQAEKKKKGATSKAAGKRPAASKPTKKGRKKGAAATSDVDSSDDEAADIGNDLPADAFDEPIAETAPAGGAGTAGGTGAETSKKPRAGRPAAPPSLLSLPHLARERPHLRGVSIRTALILTYGSGHTRKEMDTLDETVAVDPVELTSGAIHFLLQQTHDKVKAAVGSGGAGRGRPAASPTALAVQDVSSMELRGMRSAELLSTLQPVLVYSAHYHHPHILPEPTALATSRLQPPHVFPLAGAYLEETPPSPCITGAPLLPRDFGGTARADARPCGRPSDSRGARPPASADRRV
jgi:Fanconi anemia group D2 protein